VPRRRRVTFANYSGRVALSAYRTSPDDIIVYDSSQSHEQTQDDTIARPPGGLHSQAACTLKFEGVCCRGGLLYEWWLTGRGWSASRSRAKLTTQTDRQSDLYREIQLHGFQPRGVHEDHLLLLQRSGNPGRKPGLLL
jgi:hypothetical protein